MEKVLRGGTESEEGLQMSKECKDGLKRGKEVFRGSVESEKIERYDGEDRWI